MSKRTWYRDADKDGFGRPSITLLSCNQPIGYVSEATDCNDNDRTTYPNARELPDGQDNNCDGQVDEGTPCRVVWYRDADKDGFGRPGITFLSCTQPIGYVSQSSDCNDNDRTIYPNAPELPDGQDNDCDGQIDEGLACLVVWYRDADGDGFGRSGITLTSCNQPQGYVSLSTDCNDNDRNTYPNAPELPDGQDNNCNGQVDEGTPCRVVWYRDADKDGFGRPGITLQSCNQPIGYVSQATDCNDNDRNTYPNAPELPDGQDNDCDGQIDEDLLCRTVWYRDADGDGFGRPSITFLSCTQPIGYVSQATDCNDNDRTVHPNAPELCDGKDNNCNGIIDEGCSSPTKAFTKSLETKPKQNLKSLEELSVNVWPNPAKDVLMVSIDAFAANQKVAIILLQMDGKPVASKSIVPDAKGKQVRFDVSTMAAGYYILQVKQGTQSQIKKVMISK